LPLVWHSAHRALMMGAISCEKSILGGVCAAEGALNAPIESRTKMIGTHERVSGILGSVISLLYLIPR
jgi:hypothetical protein